MDHTDDYMSRELEDQVDDNPCDTDELELSEGDEEPDSEDEPSLGSIATGEHSDQERWAAGGRADLEDEHDGTEPENEGGEAVHEDDEPSLGWTDEEAARSRYAGSFGSSADLEAGEAARAPQDRTDLGTGVWTEATHRRYLRGLTPQQEKAFREQMRAGNTTGVLVR